MSNTTCRPHGIAKRALALLTAIALATALIPSFAFAGEVNNVAATTAEQSQATESANSSSAVNDAASRAETTAPDANGAQTSSSSNTAEDATASSPKANVGEATNPNSGEPTNQASSTKADTVSATLKISVYGTTLVSHTFDIEKGKTVEDMLNLAVEQGYISSYSYGKPLLGHTAYYVNSITVNGIAYTQPADYSEYWSSTINGAWENNGINGNIIETDGFSYELNYASNDPNTKYDNGTGTYPTSPNAPHPDKATGSDTTSYVKSEGNTSTVTSAPTSSSNAALAWKKNYGNNNYSEILTLGDSIYFASSLLNPDWTAQPAVLHRLNAKTGEETASLQLFSAIDSTCRPVYTDGVIVVPLANGRLQGISATEMKTLWVSNAITAGDMNMSTVTAANGMVFTGTTSNWNATKGTFFGINAITGDCVWANKSEDAGYYWAGACKVGNVLVYGDNAGWLKAVDPATGKVVSQLKLSSAIRSTVVSNEAGTTVYMTTNDGTLHVLSVAIDGSLSEQNVVLDSTKALCTSTPTLFEGNLYVGGGVYGSKGYFSVIDASTLQVKSTIEVPHYVQSTPLVAKAVDGKTYAYFTCNGVDDNRQDHTSGGGAWVYCLETNTATKLFDATGSMANYCTKSITMGADGTLYWTNDSGTLFALANAASSSNGNDSGSAQTPEKPGTNNQQNNKAPGSNASEHAPAATPISAGNASAAAQAPLSDAEALAENEAFNEEENGSTVTSASSARDTSSNNGNDSKGAPWLPIAGIVAGCAGLVAVGAFLFRRRSL